METIKREIEESQEKILEDIIRRLKDELLSAELRYVSLKVESIYEEEVETIEKVKRFMNEVTEKTENKKNVMGTTELFEKYQEWNKETNMKEYPNETKFEHISRHGIDKANIMGRYLVSLNYKQRVGKYEGKVVRGYEGIKYKEEIDPSINVKKFMERYTEKTNSNKDKIAVRKMLPRFYREYTNRCGETGFSKKLNKYGYKTKPSKETQRVEGRYGKEKIIKVGEPIQCVLGVRFNSEYYKEMGWSKDHETVN